ncbi:MAG: ClbS/DfsB family four-helix bundle protein [Acidobacteria bacterium]|nr:ClbS/DfsB family four-helix bundle protein [Acidobacteriota bacterium]
MKYESKHELIDDIRTEHASLWARLAEIPDSLWNEPGVWGDGWNLNDLVAHLAEWQFMFLRWYDDGLNGVKPEMPAPGFKWSEMPRLNRLIREKHRSRSLSAVRADFDSGYERILNIAESLTPAQLFEPGHFSWTGKSALKTYLGANTASHYRFAMKAVKRWQRHGPKQSDQK